MRYEGTACVHEETEQTQYAAKDKCQQSAATRNAGTHIGQRSIAHTSLVLQGNLFGIRCLFGFNARLSCLSGPRINSHRLLGR